MTSGEKDVRYTLNIQMIKKIENGLKDFENYFSLTKYHLTEFSR